jgi:hypothetical protein
MHNLVHFPRLIFPETIFPVRIQEYTRSIFLPREELDERFQYLKIMKVEFTLFAFPLKADIEKAPENCQMELINLQCDTNMNQTISETKLQDFYIYLPKEKFWVKNECNVRQHVFEA